MRHIQIVVVLYQQRWSDTGSAQQLSDLLGKDGCELLIYDNSPQADQDPFFEDEKVEYVHDPENPGVATAYQCGYELAKKKGAWLLLLDQDTKISSDYIEDLLTLKVEEKVAAIVPTVFHQEKQISPVYSSEYVDRTFETVPPGMTDARIMAINSGALLNPMFLDVVGGFSLEFPLDFLDHWLFYEIYQKQWLVMVRSYQLEHDLSVMDFNNVSVKRYQSILNAEKIFYQKYDRQNWQHHRKHLLLRMLKQFLLVKNRRIWKLTGKSYWQSRRG